MDSEPTRLDLARSNSLVNSARLDKQTSKNMCSARLGLNSRADLFGSFSLGPREGAKRRERVPGWTRSRILRTDTKGGYQAEAGHGGGGQRAVCREGGQSKRPWAEREVATAQRCASMDWEAKDGRRGWVLVEAGREGGGH